VKEQGSEIEFEAPQPMLSVTGHDSGHEAGPKES